MTLEKLKDIEFAKKKYQILFLGGLPLFRLTVVTCKNISPTVGRSAQKFTKSAKTIDSRKSVPKYLKIWGEAPTYFGQSPN